MTAPDERTSDTTTSAGGHYCDCDLTDARRRLAARSPPLSDPQKIKRNAVSWLVRDEERDLGGGCAYQIGRGRRSARELWMHATKIGVAACRQWHNLIPTLSSLAAVFRVLFVSKLVPIQRLVRCSGSGSSVLKRRICVSQVHLESREV